MDETLDFSASREAVRRHLERFGAAGRIRRLAESTATVDLAARALGVAPDQIAKTLAVRARGSGEILALVARGRARLDNAKFKARFGGKPRFIADADCLEAVGHPPGGVCPFGLKRGARVCLDVSLKAFAEIYPAAGAPDNCVRLSPEELSAWTGGEWVDVCSDG
ncbi:MAG: YbaK/EbsC family protein [Planctomycetota bacterium]|jgi:prolyl-tRNA editing enzyme YbaK/EbsC (Cys-tRNA(Pro) deacylase)|nr:YbaK/EbsC family protein [Planctomycetota bacterium]